MCCRGAKKDLGLSVAASTAKVWWGGASFIPRNKQINSNQISLLAVTFKQFNLHPYVKRRAAL